MNEELHPLCPIRNIIARFADKWSLLILYTLNQHSTLRFNEVRKQIPDISQKMLTTSLRTLEEDGLVSRKVYAEVPPRVEYSLTDTGKSLVPIILQLTEWAQNNMKTIIEHRNKHNEKQ